MIEWPVVIGGYLAIGIVALYLQHRYSIAVMDKLAEAHKANVADLRMMIDTMHTFLVQEHKLKQHEPHTEAEL